MQVFTVAFSPDGNYLCSAGEDRKIKLWDLRSGVLFKEFKGHTDIVHSLHFDNNSEVLCSSDLDKSVKFWDVHRKNIKIGPESTLGQETKYLNHSNELIRSMHLDFSVYSVYCDVQNVFYLNGARKPVHSSAAKADEDKSNQTNLTKSVKTDSHNQKLKNQQAPSQILMNQPLAPSASNLTMNTRRRAAQAAMASINNNNSFDSAAAANNSTTGSYFFSNDDDLYEA